MPEVLSIVSDQDRALSAYLFRKALADAKARVEAVTVDRSVQEAMSTLIWDVSEEFRKGEERLKRIKAQFNQEDRIYAWRELEKLPDARKFEPRSWLHALLRR